MGAVLACLYVRALDLATHRLRLLEGHCEESIAIRLHALLRGHFAYETLDNKDTLHLMHAWQAQGSPAGHAGQGHGGSPVRHAWQGLG